MPSQPEAIETARALLASFAERTGLDGTRPPQRYLWTDAFAVCTWLGLTRLTGDGAYTARALELVEQVHQVLGRHRDDETTHGWLSGLPEQEGAAHPTRGGLRIGKKLPERRPDQLFDEQLEWDRDGQYFHYLTKWMHALDLVARATGDARFNVWARELAAVAHARFVHGPASPGKRRMAWKMSVDLSRPLVHSMGQHDPLDGFITCMQLESTARTLPSAASGPSLKDALADFAGMLRTSELPTADPLGLGGLLSDASRVAQLSAAGVFAGAPLLAALLAGAYHGLTVYARQSDLRQPADLRLAFRELGLAIGLSALPSLRVNIQVAPGMAAERAALLERLEQIEAYEALGPTITSFWLHPVHQRASTWLEHHDINAVMLATSLIPNGYLGWPDALPET